jgi:hypothetical protein
MTRSAISRRFQSNAMGALLVMAHPDRWTSMRAILFICILLICSSAAGDDYFRCREWVERHCTTNSVPPGERLFVGRRWSPSFATFVKFHKDIRLREIIDNTPIDDSLLKGRALIVCIMRLDYLRTGPFTRHEVIRIRPPEDPDCEVQSQDVIWVTVDDDPPGEIYR